MNHIVVGDSAYINSYLEIGFKDDVNSVIYTPTWSIDTLRRTLTRAAKSVNVVNLIPSLTSCYIVFTAANRSWIGTFIKENNTTWTLSKIGGNISSGFVNDNTGGVEAPVSGVFTIIY